jgi:hypothetical protein
MKEINLLKEEKIRQNLDLFKKDCGPCERYASFDYCFNYFQGFKNKTELAEPENIQNSCLHLGFYLASWGMFHNSFLQQKSMKFYKPLIKYISEKENNFWKIDVSSYTDENIDLLIGCKEKIIDLLGRNNAKSWDTLVTKIMLGVFGNVPAFDSYFRIGSNLGTFNKHSLKQIKIFYDKNSKTISEEADAIKTFEYDTCKNGNRKYTEAKIIDMIFFMEGFQNDKKKQKMHQLFGNSE